MCGILGRIGIDKNYSQNDLTSFKRALKLQRHRGPDGSGIYFEDNCILGHRRLSIIDISHSSDQPMKSNCDNYVITFNGEIYNFKTIFR